MNSASEVHCWMCCSAWGDNDWAYCSNQDVNATAAQWLAAAATANASALQGQAVCYDGEVQAHSKLFMKVT